MLIAAGAGVLALTGAGMIVKDPLFDRFAFDHDVYDWVVKAMVASLMFAVGLRSVTRTRVRAGQGA